MLNGLAMLTWAQFSQHQVLGGTRAFPLDHSPTHVLHNVLVLDCFLRYFMLSISPTRSVITNEHVDFALNSNVGLGVRRKQSLQ